MACDGVRRWFLAVVGMASAGASAQVPGTFDTTWRPNGRIIVAADSADAFVPTVVAPIDGHVVVAGSCINVIRRQGCALRLDTAGNIDAAYGDPFALNNIVRSDLAGIDPLPDIPGLGFIADVDASGRVVFMSQTGGPPARVGRLNASGSAASGPPATIDLLFGGGGQQYVVEIASAGTALYVAATVDLDGTNQDIVLARLGPDLRLDPSFNGTGVRRVGFDNGRATDDAMRRITVAPDGRVFAVVNVSERGTGFRQYWVVCFNPDGSLDSSFGAGGRTQVPVPASISMHPAVDALGRVVLAGSYEFSAPDFDGYVTRLTSGGVFDGAFNNGDVRRLPIDLINGGADFVEAVALQTDGRIVVAGRARAENNTDRFFIARVNDDGSRDLDFGAVGQTAGSFGFVAVDAGRDTGDRLSFDAAGRLLIAGTNRAVGSGTLRVGVARIVTGVVVDPLLADGFE